MSRDEGARPHGLNLEFTVAVAIFGAATFAALVLVIQDPTNFKVAQTGLLLSQTGEQEFHDLVIYLGAVCVMSAFSVLSTAFVGAGLVRFDSLLGWFGYALGGMTISGFAVAVWLIVSNQGDFESDLILSIIGILSLVFFVGLWRGLPAPRAKA